MEIKWKRIRFISPIEYKRQNGLDVESIEWGNEVSSLEERNSPKTCSGIASFFSWLTNKGSSKISWGINSKVFQTTCHFKINESGFWSVAYCPQYDEEMRRGILALTSFDWMALARPTSASCISNWNLLHSVPVATPCYAPSSHLNFLVHFNVNLTITADHSRWLTHETSTFDRLEGPTKRETVESRFVALSD